MQNSFNAAQTTVNNQKNSPSSGSDAMSHRLPELWPHSLFLEPMAKRASRHGTVSVDMDSGSAAVAGLRSEVDAMQAAMQKVRSQIHHLTDQLVQTNIQVQQVAGTHQIGGAHPMEDSRQYQMSTAALPPHQGETQSGETQPGKKQPGKKQLAQPRNKAPEPATKPSTYVVPKRSRSSLFDQLTRSIPFSVLIVMFGVTLVAAVALASPSVALWMGLSEVIMPLLRGLFVTIAFGSAIAFILELCH